MSPILSKTYEVVGNHDRTGGNAADAVWQREFNLPTINSAKDAVAQLQELRTDKKEADEIKGKLEAVGATVNLK